jgi:hypothetical protein
VETLDRQVAGLRREVSELKKWRDSVSPMLNRLADDQAYRARWVEERGKRWARWQRGTAWAGGILGAVAVFAAAVAQLAHLF